MSLVAMVKNLVTAEGDSSLTSAGLDDADGVGVTGDAHDGFFLEVGWCGVAGPFGE